MSVATIGFFDGVHTGHRYLLRELQTVAQEQGETSLVLTFRRHPREVLHRDYVPQLLTTPDERFRLLQQTGVDRVEMLQFEDIQQLTAQEFLLFIHQHYGVDTLLMGYDHHFGSDRLTDFSLYEQAAWKAGVALRQVSCYAAADKVSSTTIRRLLKEGSIAAANRLLGYAYRLSGQVVEGRHIGRTLGFPTANIALSCEHKLVPCGGVYKVQVEWEGQCYDGLLNIGTNPTVGGEHLTLEAYIFDFDKDIYGATIQVSLLSFLREERKFASLEELQQQIQQDFARVRLQKLNTNTW